MLELVSNVDLVNTLATVNTACDQIPDAVFNIVSLIIMAIQVVVPILLIIWGMVDFAKSVVGGDEDKIKAGQKVFLKRLIAAVVVFLVVTIVKLLVGLVTTVGGTESGIGSKEGITGCVDKFINGAGQ